MSITNMEAYKKIQQAFNDMFLYDAVIFRVINRFNRLENYNIKTYRFGFVGPEPVMEYNPDWINTLGDKLLIDHMVFDGVRVLLNHVSGRRTGNDRGFAAIVASNTTLVELGMGTQFNIPDAKETFKHLIKGEQYDKLGQLILELDNKILMEHEFEELYGITADYARQVYNKMETSLYDSEDLESQNIELYHGLMRTSGGKAQAKINLADAKQETPEMSDHFAPESLEEQAFYWEDNPLFNQEIKKIIDHAKHSGNWGSTSGLIKENIIAAYSGKIPFVNKLRNWIQKGKMKQNKKKKTSLKFSRHKSEVCPEILTKGVSKSGGLKILLAVDTSGSVGTIDLQRGYGVINKFIRAGGCELTVMQFDTEIKSVKKYTRVKPTFEITGRGGTCVEDVIKYANKHKEEFSGLIVFTDGDFSKDLPHCELPDLLWVHVSKSDHERNKDTYKQGDVAYF